MSAHRAQLRTSGQRSMQLHMGLATSRHCTCDGIQPYLYRAVQCGLVHFVKGAIHEAGKIPLDQQAFAGDEAHQTADRAEFSERYQRPEITIAERFDWQALQSALDLFQKM